MSASVLKLAVATVLTVASVAAMIAIFLQLHSIFIKPRRQLCIIFPNLLCIIPFCPFFSNYSQFLDPPIILKTIPE